MTIDHRLATYGSLAPGRCNHHELAGLIGEWQSGTVRGMLIEQGWGADLGYPAIVLSENGEAIAVDLFVSADLPAYWPRLDAFEGAGYRRIAVEVHTAAGPVAAWIYAAADTVAA